MKKISFVLMILFVASTLFASTTDVFKSTTEIQAYKKLVFSDSLIDEPETPIPQSVTFRILAENDSEVGIGGSSYSGSISSGNYNQPIRDVFKWKMTGNALGTVSVSFTFWPLYEGRLDIAGNMTISDYTTIIPYTVTLYNNQTTVYFNSTNNPVGDTKPNASGSYEQKQKQSDNYYYRLYYGDSKSFLNSKSSVKVIGSANGTTITESFNLLTNTLVRRSSSKNGTYNNYNNALPFSTCQSWTRSGYATIQLHLNSDMASWTDTDGQDPATYSLPSGSHTYTANVFVTITAD